MRNIFTLLLFLFTSVIFGQNNIPNLELKKYGAAPIIIIVDSLKSNILYDKTKEWIQLNYNDPSEVLKGDIKNSNIRINGLKRNAWKAKKFSYDVQYWVTIEFKEGKYKFNFEVEKFILSDGGKCYFGVSNFFDEKGNVKEKAKEAVKQINIVMNSLSKSLYNYINELEKNDW